MAQNNPKQVGNGLYQFVGLIDQNGKVIDPQKVSFNEGLTDAFNRLQVANPFSLTDIFFLYNKREDEFQEIATGNGNVEHVVNEAAIKLNAPDLNDKIIKGQNKYNRYQAGRGIRVELTTIPANYTENNIMKWGYFDNDNGLLFNAKTDGRLYVQILSNTTGTPTILKEKDVTDLVPDTLSIAHNNIWVIEAEWLSAGFAKFSVVDERGNYVLLHLFENAGQYGEPYMTTANLPIRYEVENTGVSPDFKAVCVSVASSGGNKPPSKEGSYTSVINTITSDGETGIIAFRASEFFYNTTIKNRVVSLISRFFSTVEGGKVQLRSYLCKECNSLDGTWNRVDRTNIEYNSTFTNTDFSSFRLIKNRIAIAESGQGNQISVNAQVESDIKDITINRKHDNTSSSVIILTAERLEAVDVLVSMGIDWSEIQ